MAISATNSTQPSVPAKDKNTAPPKSRARIGAFDRTWAACPVARRSTQRQLAITIDTAKTPARKRPELVPHGRATQAISEVSRRQV